MENFRFAQIGYAWLLLLLPALAAISFAAKRWAETKLKRFASPANLVWILGSQGLRTWHRRNYWQAAAIFFAVLALMRPQGNPTIEDVQTDGLDIIVALDVSKSMDAEDVYPSRLRKAKKSIQVLLDQLGGDRVGIVAFAGSAFLVCPLTADYEIVRTFLQSIDTSLLNNQGTNIEAALDVSIKAFLRGAKNETSEEVPSHIVIVMSDGEETSGSALAFAKEARAKGTVIHAIAYGTERGVPIPIRDNNGELQGHKRDAGGGTVLSRVNPAALEAVAKSGGGIFSFSSADDSEIETIFRNSQTQQRSTKAQVQTKLYREYFWIPLSLALIFLLLAFAPLVRWPAILVPLLILGVFQTSWAADPAPAPEIKLPWHSIFWDREKKVSEEAKQWLANKQPAQASRILLDEQARNPNSPTLDYNAATALAHEGRRPEAEQGLANPKLLQDPALKPFTLFNQAGLAAKDKDKSATTQALFESIGALESKPTLTEEEQALLSQARKNLEIIQDPEKQPQDSKDSKDSKDEQQKPKEGEPPKQEPKDPKDSKDGQEQKPQNQGADKEQKTKPPSKQKQRFSEQEDLSEQDAKRILESLKTQEGTLQKKLLKDQFGKEKGEAANNGKDW